MAFLRWGDWFDLGDPSARRRVTPAPGLYRVRDRVTHEVLYIGQSKALRGRLGQLAALYRDEIPYSDPHTAAPCLWVLRTTEGRRFEVSVSELNEDAPGLKAAECVVISEYRREAGHSPYAEFGRMPEGWVKSTGNNQGLVASGRRRRGYPDPEVHRSTSHDSVLDSERDPQSKDWAGLPWSPWRKPSQVPVTRGLYRLRSENRKALAYIGQGSIASRITAHIAKGRREGHGQQPFFGAELEVSWCTLDLPTQQLLEVECDLIAGHVLRTGTAPAAQFRG